MLKSSRCSVVFPTNGLALSGELSFQPGITAVVGRNGTGKTFRTIELWRYLLFGKKALRGPASDYKTLSASGEFTIKGVDYRVERTSKKEELIKGDEQLAVGADAVNKKIVELLGFGLEVFDITNASVQKQSNRLSQLTPAKRKELIDEVVGLAKQEKAEKDCKDKAKLLKLEAQTIVDNLQRPEKPEKPDGYRDPVAIEAELKEAREAEFKRQALLARLNEPEPPEERPDNSLNMRKTYEEERQRVENRKAELEAIVRSIPTTTCTAEQIAAAEALAAYDAEVARRGPQPEMSLEEAEEGAETWNHIYVLQRINSEVECPKCEHKFTPAKTIPAAPDRSAQYYAGQVAAHKAWEKFLPQPKGERIPVAELTKAKVALERADELTAAKDELAALPPMRDQTEKLEKQIRLTAEWDRYEKDLAIFRQAQDEWETLPAPIDIAALNELFVACRLYDAAAARYDSDIVEYEEKMAKARALREEAEGYATGAIRLVEARREVKAHLAPSMSRIASSLICEMTCGKLNRVHVDDDMNISVDGQDVTTLSGAGETAANLALRLALGRTLVSGVFPVFMADEIDSDADEERSEATFDCLRNLKKQFGQVIIITHKPHITADHVIDMDSD